MTTQMVSDFFKRLRTAPWVIIIMLAVLAALFFPIWPNGAGGTTTMTGYVLSWAGSVFKAMSGGIIGFWFVRKVLLVDLSTISDPLARSVAGLGAGIVITGFIIAVCVSV